MSIDTESNHVLNVIFIKNHLHNFTLDELREYYETESEKDTFLSSVLAMKELDPYYPLLDSSYQEKILTLNNEIRLQFKSKDVLNQANEIIQYMNGLKKLSEEQKIDIMNRYMYEQEQCRRVFFKDMDSLKYSMGFDGFAFANLFGDSTDIEISASANEFLLISINYLLQVVPEVFCEEKVKNHVREKVNEIKTKMKFNSLRHKRYIKVLFQNLNDIKK